MSTGGSESVSGSGSLMDYLPLNEQQMMNYFASKYNQKELIKMYQAAKRSSVISTLSSSSGSWDRSTVSSGYSGSLPTQSSHGSSWDNRNCNHLSSLKTVAEAPLDNVGLTTPAARDHLNGNPNSSSLPVSVASDFCVCPFCAELSINAGAKRPSDLRRHFKNFHNTNAGWVCPIMGCELVFDWPAAYETHMKEAHAGVHLPATEVMVQLHTQVVFACGFAECKKIFDTPNDSDATPIAKAYFDHVAKHIKNGASISEWTYATRIHNLMRQRLVKEPWREVTSKEVRKQLNWQPHNSGVLRRKLECRDIGDVQTLMQIAIVLGSPSYSEPNSPQFVYQGFTTPTLDGMVTAWQARNRGVSGDSRQLPPNMDPLNAASRPLFSSIASASLHGSSSYPLVGQGQYSVMSLPDTPGWNLSDTESHTMGSLQNPGQQHVPQHVQVATSQPLGYDNYNSGQQGDILSVPQHPLEQWSGSDSLGRYPSQDEVVADITNQTSSKRFFLKAKRSIETLRSRKSSATQGGGSEMNGSPPPMPSAFPPRYNIAGS